MCVVVSFEELRHGFIGEDSYGLMMDGAGVGGSKGTAASRSEGGRGRENRGREADLVRRHG